MTEEQRKQLAIDAMRAKRAELQHAPIDRIYGELFDAGKAAYLAGDVVVPREPTKDMIDSAYMAHDKFEMSDEGGWCGIGDVYRAMIAARPTTPGPGI